MLKIPKKASTNISLCLAALFIAAVAVFSAVFPLIWDDTPYFSAFCYELEANNSALSVELFFVWFYVVMIIVETCCVTVALLLLRVRKELVFTNRSVAYVRFISWGCVFLALVFIAGQIFHPFMFILALAAAFLGLCLRVVKNVLETATAIKDENDLTV